MTTWEVIGIKQISYQKKDGREVNGRELHLVGVSTMESTPSSICMGVEAKTCWLPERVNTPVNLGQLVGIIYNERGQVDDLMFMEKS